MILTNIQKILIQIGRTNRVKMFWTILVGFITSFFEVLGVSAVVPLISVILNKEAFLLFLEDYNFLIDFSSISYSTLVIYVLLLVTLIYVLKFIVTFIYFKQQAVLQRDIQIYISDNLLNVYIQMPYKRHLKYNSAKFLRNMQSEIGILSNTVLLYMNLFSEILMIMGILALMLIYDFKSTLLLFSVFLITGSLYYYFFREKIHFLGNSRFEYALKRVKVLQDIFNSIKVGKVHDMTKEYAFSYKKNNDAMAFTGAKLKVLSAMPKILFEFLAVLLILLIVYIQIFNSNSDPEKILTTLALFSVAAIRLMPSANKVLSSIQNIKSSLAGTNELMNELNIEISNEVVSNEDSFKNWSKIFINDISYKYPLMKEDVLSSISFELKRGEVIGFYGQSGSGKSTLIDLISGLLSPSFGSISIDSRELSPNPKKWMECIGYVPQETYLLDSNILHNVVGGDYSSKSINTELLEQALKISGLNKIINKLPQGSMTQVGQGGSSLSGGQKQRVGIARAIYRNPSLLILDEPTSSLDKESKDLFRDLLLNYKDTITFIIVSHEQKDMDICTKVIEIRDGKLKSIIKRD